MVGLVGNPVPGSRTATVSLHVVEAVGAALDLLGEDTVTVDLADRAGDAAAQAGVADARVLVVATPSYKGSHPGLLELFLDTLALVAAVQAGASSRSTTRSANAPALAGTASR